MKLRRIGMVLFGSLVGSGILLVVLLYRKKAQLGARSELFRMQLEARENSPIASQQLAALKVDLGHYAETLANHSADDFVGRVYGLTPDRMQKLSHLLAQFGIH